MLTFLSRSRVTKPGKPGRDLIPLLIVGLLASIGCGGRIYLVSSLGPPHSIVVDGEADDWSGALSYVASDHLFVGFVNDREDLFICLNRETTGGRPGAPMSGVTVWIDPSGGSDKTMGIRLAGPTEGPSDGTRPEGEPARGERRRPERQPEIERPARELGQEASPIAGGSDIEVLGPNGAVVRRLAAEAAAAAGLEVRSGFAGGSYILEVKIPLAASESRPIAVGAGPGGIIGVGFVSSSPRGNGRPGGPPESGPGGGAGMPGGVGGVSVQGGMGGPGGMRPGMRPNMDPDIGKALKVWTRVKLRPADEPGRSTILGFA